MNSKIHDKKRLFFSLFFWCLVAICMVTIFMLSNQAAVQSDSLSKGLLEKIMEYFHISISNHIIRKTAHGLEYFGLALLVFTASRFTWNKNKPVFAFLFASLYSVSDEIHQHFIPGRAPRFTDVCIDSTGALAAILLCLLLVFLFGKRKKRKRL